MRLRLFENFRFLLYAPFYAAHATGAYAAEGVEVELLPSPGPGKAEAALCAGEVDVIWCGPLRIMKHHDEHKESPITAFAEVVCRDPFSLVGREPRPGFRLANLAELRLATVSEVPTPWVCLAEDLRQAGLDPGRLDRVADRSMADNFSALRAGGLAAMQCFEPVVQQAVAQGMCVWQPASARGRTSYTVFATTRQRLAADPEPFRRMVRAIYRTQRWLYAQPVAALGDAVAPYFPALDRATLTGALARYKAQGIWNRDPVVSEAGVDRLRHAMLSAGYIGRPVPFAECVDNRLAEERVAAGG